MFENETVEIICPNCGNKTQENVGRLKINNYICPSCGATGDTSKLTRDLEEVDDLAEKLRSEFARAKKTLEGG